MSAPAPLTLLKLGGSLITDKTGVEVVRERELRRLAREITRALPELPGGLLIGHGAGSFGHVAARKHGVGSGPLDARGLRGAARTQDRAAALHRLVVGALLEAGASPFSLAPSSFLTARAGRPRSMHLEPLGRALERGMLPVIYGDVVQDEAWGASICSTETLFLALVPRLLRRGHTVSRALWLGETEGIYDESGRTLPRLARKDLSRLGAAVGGSRGTDVTGGMAHRLDAAGRLAARGIPSLICDGRVKGRLGRALRGKDVPGTHVVP